MSEIPDFLWSTSPLTNRAAVSVSQTSSNGITADNIASAISASTATSETSGTSTAPLSQGSQRQRGWSNIMGGMAMAGSLVHNAQDVLSASVVTASSSNTPVKKNEYSTESHQTPTSAPSSGNAFSLSALTSNIISSSSSAASALSSNVQANLQPLQSLTKSISNNITGTNTLPDKTTASQVLMFRQLLHTKCRPGLRLSRSYEGTVAQKAVLHMPWWERGIEQSKKMIISYDNLITRLWLSGAIMPFEKGGYASAAAPSPSCNHLSSIEEDLMTTISISTKSTGSVDTLINERGLPPIPHQYWIDRLGFQQDDPVTDFRSGGVLSLAMLVHIVESCPAVHSRFLPKQDRNKNMMVTRDEVDFTINESEGIDENIDGSDRKHHSLEITLEEIITEDASVLPFGITCINITDMLAKFLLFSKSIDKMDALLSAKPFWKMFIDPNAMLVLQEVSLDLLCDVCVEVGRERRLARLLGDGSRINHGKKQIVGLHGSIDGRVTVFDFSEIMERTEKRVGDEILGAGPQNIDELRAIARRVKSKYLMRIQCKENHLVKQQSSSLMQLTSMSAALPSKDSIKNITNSVMGGMGGFVTMWKSPNGTVTDANKTGEMKSNLDNPVRTNDETSFGVGNAATVEEGVELQYYENDLLSSPTPANPFSTPLSQQSEYGVDNGITAIETYDFLDSDIIEDFAGDLDHFNQNLLDAIHVKLDPVSAFTIDENEILAE